MPDQSNQPDPVPYAAQAPIPAQNETPTSDKPAKHSLTYAPDSQQVKKRARRRKQFYIAGLLALIISSYWWAPATYRRINYEIALYQCRNHEFPPNTIVVDTTINPPYWGPHINCLARLDPLATPMTTIYLHHRYSASRDEDDIVVAEIPSTTTVHPAPSGYQYIIFGLPYRGIPKVTPPAVYVPVPMNVQIFAGQTDPHDPSHFTIDYVADGVRHTIDGYVSFHEVIVELRPSTPAATSHSIESPQPHTVAPTSPAPQ